MTFPQYLAAFALGRVRTEELPAAALKALEEGFDARDLVMLAAAPLNAAPPELLDLWNRGVRQLGLEIPSRAEAGRTLRDYFVSCVALGSIPPREGAAVLVALATNLVDVLPDRAFAGDGLGIARLLGLHVDHGEVPESDASAHRGIDDEIRAECRRMVEARPRDAAR